MEFKQQYAAYQQAIEEYLNGRRLTVAYFFE